MIEYKDVLIVWEDEQDEKPSFTNVAIHPNWTEDDDDPRIFYFFQDLEEFEEAKKPFPNGHEFRIVEEIV